MKLNITTRGEGRDLLLLHGWGMNSAIWGAFGDSLAQQFRVTLVDLPGHGSSGYDPERSSLDEWVDMVLAVAPEQAVWIGWSLGSMVAQRAAVLAPQRLSGLVTLAGTPRFIRGDGWDCAIAAEVLQQFARELERDHQQTLNRFLALQLQGDTEARSLLRHLRQQLAERPAPATAALEAGLELLLSVDLRRQLQSIACPQLWLLGERDTLVPASLGRELQELLPDSVVKIVSGAAHTPFLSHPDYCLEQVDGFFDSPP
jgi:pimeloyl-[acyl-carrier protein] methyl ester esterase